MLYRTPNASVTILASILSDSSWWDIFSFTHTCRQVLLPVAVNMTVYHMSETSGHMMILTVIINGSHRRIFKFLSEIHIEYF